MKPTTANRWRERIFSRPDFLKPYEHPLPDFPFYVDVEPTNVCNFVCVMCTTTIMSRKKGVLSEEHHSRLLDEMSPYANRGVGIRYVRHGEPTLHHALPQFVAAAEAKGILTYVSTNAYTLDKCRDALLDAGLSYLRVSMQGVDRQGFDAFRDPEGRDHYLKLVRNVADFVAERERRNLSYPWIAVGTTVTTETEDEIRMFKRFWDDVADEVQVGLTTFSRVEGKSAKADELKAQIGFDDRVVRQYAPCTEIRTKLSVNYNGLITACCSDQDGELVGTDEWKTPFSVEKHSLKQVWESQYLDELRDDVGPNRRHASRSPCNICYREQITTKFGNFDDVVVAVVEKRQPTGPPIAPEAEESAVRGPISNE